MKTISRFLLLTATAIVALISNSTSHGQEYEPELGEFEFSGNNIVLSAMNQNGHLKVNVGFGDGTPRAFIVDTGASVNVIDSGVAESLGYEVIGEMEIGAPGGPQIPAGIVKVPLAHIGDGTIIDAEFVTMDVAGFSGGGTLGVIGVGLFRDYLLAFDYGQNEIRLSRESLSPQAGNVFPYNGDSEIIEVTMDVAGTVVPTHIDTGSMGGFTLPVEMKESLQLNDAAQSSATARVVGGDRKIEFGQLDGDIVFAGTRFEDPVVAFMDPSPGAGNVGARILSEFVMSIDQANHLVRFEKLARAHAVAASGAPRRLGVQFRGMPGGSVLTVGFVEPGSLAEKAGLLPGDVLQKLNNKPTEDYDMPSLGALIGSSEPLHIEIDRNGEMQTVEIQ